MAMEAVERRGVGGVVRAPQQGVGVEQQAQAQAQGPPLPCPRCTSTNTKFCYYNNYNFSQPRHFCKSCRRYWTQGGTLRDIPVGGGTRKTAKRSRTITTATTTSPSVSCSVSAVANNTLTSTTTTTYHQQAPLPLSAGGGFTSLLGLGGFGLGLGLGLDDVGYYGSLWAFPQQHQHDGGLYVSVGGVKLESGSRSDTWQMESGEKVGYVGGGGGVDCFNTIPPLPELAISTSSDKGLSSPQVS